MQGSKCEHLNLRGTHKVLGRVFLLLVNLPIKVMRSDVTLQKTRNKTKQGNVDASDICPT